MSIGARAVQGVSVLDLDGKIILGDSSAEIRDTIRELVESGQKQIVLNMADVVFMDSSGIASLIDAYLHLRQYGGQLKLLNPSEKLNERLAMTKVLTVIESFKDEELAVESFHKPKKAP